MDCVLTVIIVNWNGAKFLPKCLNSIIDNPPGVAYEIVVVDNDSRDGSAEWLKSDECLKLLGPIQYSFIESGSNLGFGKANNIAIERSTAPFVFLLNPDTLVRPHSIDLLLESLTSEKNAGAVAPKLFNQDGSLQPSAWYFPPTPLTIVLENFRLYKLLSPRYRANKLLFSHWNHNERRPVPIVWGAAIMFDGTVLRQLKGFDPDFKMYGEDMDLCIRLAKTGKQLIFIPEAEIIHLGGQSAAQMWSESEINEKKIKMGIFFEKKHCSKALFVANMIARIGVEAIRVVINAVSGRRVHSTLQLMRLYWRGLFN